MLDDGGTEAEVSDLSEPENRFEQGFGRLLEVYTQVWTPEGQPLLFEAYYSYDEVSERSAGGARRASGRSRSLRCCSSCC